MEEYCKTASVVFIPFRKISTLKIDDSFHLGFRHYVNANKLSVRHRQILSNIQNCWNSINAGWPEDILERKTQALDKHTRNDGDAEEKPQHTSEAFASLVNTSTSTLTFVCPRFRNQNKLLQVSKQLSRPYGVNSCGNIDCSVGTIVQNEESSIFMFSSTHHPDSNEKDTDTKGHSVYLHRLHRLAATKISRQLTKTGQVVYRQQLGQFKISKTMRLVFLKATWTKKLHSCVWLLPLYLNYTKKQKNQMILNSVPPKRVDSLNKSNNLKTYVNKNNWHVSFRVQEALVKAMSSCPSVCPVL